jgi:6-pyruvoyltetrahydropterin/6-carboxytetrahydropterin synthase
MLIITKRFEFCYGHRLPSHDGKCANQHGHNGILEIEIYGVPEKEGPKAGMIMDFGDLKKIVNEQVIEKLDHQYLNDLISFIPTAENLVTWIKNILFPFLPGLRRIRLYETSTSYCEWVK